MIRRCLRHKKKHHLSNTFLAYLGIFLLSFLLLEIAISLYLIKEVQAQEGWVTLFQDDFEAGNANNWRLDSSWQVEQDGANYVLSGSGRSAPAHARFKQILKDYRFNLQVKLINEGVHLNVRENNTGRYFIGVNEYGISLNKQFWPDTFFNDLARADFPITMGQWHTISILVQGRNIQAGV